MKQSDFNQLAESIKQAGEIKTGKRRPGRVFEFPVPDIKGIRHRLHLSQRQFATMIGVSMDTIQNWEQKRREPEGPAKALLRIADKNPKAVLAALYY
jgi:putative transcriptional regulator